MKNCNFLALVLGNS